MGTTDMLFTRLPYPAPMEAIRRKIARSIAFLRIIRFRCRFGHNVQFSGFPAIAFAGIRNVICRTSSFFPGLYLIRRFDRRLVWVGDRRTAVVLGKGNLLQVLEKIDSMRQSDYVEGRQDEWREFMFVPTPAQRIANLQTSQ